MTNNGATAGRAATADDRPAPPASRTGRAPATGARSDRDARGDDEESGQDGRSSAELVTLGISALIVALIVALTTYFHLTGGSGPAIVDVRAAPELAYQSGERYYLPVEVANTGQSAGEDVRVTLSLTDAEGRQESAGLEFRFLPAGASSRGVVSFRSDPRQGQLGVEGVSYLEP